MVNDDFTNELYQLIVPMDDKIKENIDEVLSFYNINFKNIYLVSLR